MGAVTRPADEGTAAEPRPARRGWRRARRVLGTVVGVALLAVLITGLVVRSRLRASLPQLDGQAALPGLGNDVTVRRDALGVPTIRGRSRLDVARATGYVHAQDRFFQMDLTRRQAAGELAELVGAAVVEADLRMRVHRFRDVARRVALGASAEDRALIEAYAAGVNAGLQSLGAPPVEYLLLRTTPAPWKPEDSVLVLLAMFNTLQSESWRHEVALGAMADTLPPALVELLAPQGTEWDAPVVGGPLAAPPLPGPEVVDLRRGPPASAPAAASRPASLPAELPPKGSNNWAVAGRLTTHGGPIIANDMHLQIMVPNTWYRAALEWGGGGGERRIVGATLPGTPAVVVGSTGRVAWAFTNSFGDFADIVVVETDPRDPLSYRTPSGPRRFERHAERIAVRGAAERTLDVQETIWGPVVARDHRGRPLALRWAAHDPAAVNLKLMALEEADDLEAALTLAAQCGIPAQNFVGGDRSGRIGWTVAGRIPRRVGFGGRFPSSWADGTRRWDGWLAPAEHPRVVDPPNGRLWTANTRVVDGEMLARLGDGGYQLGARARAIRDLLLARERFTERDMLPIQIDDRAVFLERWRDLALRTLTDAAVAGQPARAEVRRLLQQSWSGRAAIDSAAYRLVRDFRSRVQAKAIGPLVQPVKDAEPRFDVRTLYQVEGPLWRLVSERPAHLLKPRYRSWDELLLEAVDDTIVTLGKRGPLAQRTWGEINVTKIQHPFSLARPWLSRWLDMPREPVPGDTFTPRAQRPSAGASERLAVSPGHEADGYFHMPGGQSGHPLSPYYRAGHEAWVKGEPLPFLPGAAQHTLTLVPETRFRRAMIAH
jgi:penicillin G amidase